MLDDLTSAFVAEKTLKKRMIIMGIALAVVFGGIILWHTFISFMTKRFFASYEAPPVSVSSVVTQKVQWTPYIPAVGNFVAINGVEVNAQTSGNVTAIHFDSGQYVDKDMPLIDIDDAIDRTILKSNQAELTLKQLNYQRQVELHKRGASPSSTVDEAKAMLQQAEASTEKVQAEIKQKHIVTPFAGLLGIRQINLGQFIKPGDTGIVTLQSLDPLFLDFYLPEQDFKRLHPGQAITFGVDELPGMRFKGQITAINAKVDVNTHNIQVQATVPNCPAELLEKSSNSSLIKKTRDKQDQVDIITCDTALNTKNKVKKFLLLPGMFASLQVSLPAIADTIALPSTAISYSLYGNAVYVIEKDSSGKKNPDGKDRLVVRRIFVTTGEQRGNYTVITKGLKEGQTVVSSGEIKLQNGTQVVINNDVVLKDVANPDSMGQ